MTYQEVYTASYNGSLDALTKILSPYVTQVEAARIMGISTKTIQRMIRAGRLETTSEGKLLRATIHEKLKI